MNIKLIPAVLGTACAVVAIQSFFPANSRAAGPLNPPPGAPAPNMVSLAELSQQVDDLKERLDARIPGGKNLAVATSNGQVSVWDHATNEWNTFQLGGVIGPLTESQGNFLFISSLGSAAAWSSETKTWKAVHFPTTNISGSGGSDGNFYLTTRSGHAAAWSKKTGQWSSQLVTGFMTGSAGAEGNFLFASNQGVALVWNQNTGTWKSKNFGSFLIPIGSDKR